MKRAVSFRLQTKTPAHPVGRDLYCRPNAPYMSAAACRIKTDARRVHHIFGTADLYEHSRHDGYGAMTPHEQITEDGIAELVDRFYGKVRRDPMIGPLFNAAIHDWDAHLVTLRAFWSSVMLTTGRYKGNPMAAHVKHPIRPEFFTRWLALWGETADEVFTPAAAEQFRLKANRIAESLKLALFFRPGAPLGDPRAQT